MQRERERERERERKERKDKFYCSVKNTLIKEIMKINSNQMREMPTRSWLDFKCPIIFLYTF